MEDQVFAQKILKGDMDARSQFIELYSDVILRGLLRKCQQHCFNHSCPIRFGLTQRNFKNMSCDELANLYVFSLESIFKILKSYHSDESLDKWVERQTNPNGIFFRQRFAAYMASKYPLTGRARIPDRFQNRWSPVQKKIYKFWLRQRSASEIAVKLKLPETEVIMILEGIIIQLREAGLLVALQEGVQLENLQQRTHNTDEEIQSYEQAELLTNADQSEISESLGNISQPYIELSDELLIEALQNGVELALSYLSNQERRILALKFDAEWTLRSISEQCDKLGLEKMTEKQVGHAIDSILRKMLPMINRALADIDDADIKLPALKQILLEWGTQG